MAEGAGPAPDEAERAHAGGVPRVERRQAGVDRLGALEVQHHGERAVGAAAVQRGDVGDHATAPSLAAASACARPIAPAVKAVACAWSTGSAYGMSDSDPREPTRRLRRGRVDREQAAGQAAGAGAREVDVALGQAGEEVRGRAAVGLQLAQRVVVAVEDRGHVWSRSIHLCSGDRLGGLERGQEVVEVVADRQQRAHLRAQEALLHGVVEEGDERLVVARHVQQPQRLGVDAQLRPGVDLEELLERADAAGQRDEGVGELRHQRLALVHRADHPQVVEAGVADLAVEERLGNDADDLAARAARRFGQGAHHPDASRRRRRPHAALRQRRARRPRRPPGRPGRAPALEPQKTQIDDSSGTPPAYAGGVPGRRLRRRPGSPRRRRGGRPRRARARRARRSASPRGWRRRRRTRRRPGRRPGSPR